MEGLKELNKGRRAKAEVVNKLKNNHQQIEQWENFCEQIGEDPANVALAWLLNQPGVTAPIIGPRTMQQFNESIKSLEIKFNEELLSKLDKIFPPAGISPQYYAW